MPPYKALLVSILFLSQFLPAAQAAPNAEKIRMGVILPLTGSASAYGELVRQGIESVGHQDFELIYEDDACEPAKALSAFRKLVEIDHVKLLLGPVCPGGTLAIAPLLAQQKIVSMGMCSGVERAITASQGRVFLPQYSADKDAAANAEKMFQLGVRRAAVVYWTQEFSSAHEQSFRRHFQGKVAGTIAFDTVGKDEVKNGVLKLKTMDFDAVYVPIYEPFLFGFMTEMRRMGLGEKRVFSIFSIENPAVLSVEGKNAEGLIFSAPKVATTLPLGSYFARLGTEIMLEAAKQCSGEAQCVYQTLSKDPRFKNGILKDALTWRTVRDGAFVALETQSP